LCKINIKPVAPLLIVCIILVIELNNQKEGKMSLQGERYTTKIFLKLSKAEAIKSGQKVFWNGKACPNQHITWRLVLSGGCRECESKRKFNKKFPDFEPSEHRVKSENLRNQIELSREIKEVYET
jgi:hypothetical protein